MQTRLSNTGLRAPREPPLLRRPCLAALRSLPPSPFFRQLQPACGRPETAAAGRAITVRPRSSPSNSDLPSSSQPSSPAPELPLLAPGAGRSTEEAATEEEERGMQHRRDMLLRWLAAVPLAAVAGAVTPADPASALTIKAVDCPGMGGYLLQKCLRKARLAREAAAPPESEGERFKYNNPGTLVTMPSGIQYRDIQEGNGPVAATLGSCVELSYIVYRLASGGYFKYSGGGTPVFLWGVGYGSEGKDDVGETYNCTLGAPLSLPAAVTPALVGMRAGGKRRVVVPPQLGWVNNEVGPHPDSFGSQRRLEVRREEPLLFEAEMRRVYASPKGAAAFPAPEEVLGQPFRLPLPLSPNSNKLPQS